MSDVTTQPARACGLDFGTSNSTAGWLCPGRQTLLALEDGRVTLPSVVFFNAETDSSSVGRAALTEYLDGYEGRLMRSLKSLLGSRLLDEFTEVNGRSLSFRELLAFFLNELRQRAQNAAGREFTAVVLGRPVHFVDDDPRADRLAQDTLESVARAAGFTDIAFQYEPVAAALHHELSVTREELVLVADIGGGTSDFSLVRLGPDRTRRLDRSDDVLACSGVHIGGTDFDKYLSLAGVMPLFGLGSRLKNNAEVPSSYFFNFATWHTINFNYTRKVARELMDVLHDARDRDQIQRLMRLVEQREGHWLAMQVEEAKIGLSDHDEVFLALDRIESGLGAALQRTRFEAAIMQPVERVRQAVREVLQRAGVTAEAVNTVFVTGGSSRVPALRAGIAAEVPQASLVEGDSFGSIGAGLAADAARRFG